MHSSIVSTINQELSFTCGGYLWCTIAKAFPNVWCRWPLDSLQSTRKLKAFTCDRIPLVYFNFAKLELKITMENLLHKMGLNRGHSLNQSRNRIYSAKLLVLCRNDFDDVIKE